MAEGRLTTVIGATGNVGASVVSQLVEAGVRVRGVSRRPRPEGFPERAEYLQTDLERPETLEPALRGVDAVFLVWPFLTADPAPPVLDLIAQYAHRLVYLSSNGIHDGAAKQGDPINQFHADLEQLITQAGLGWTFLRAGGLAVNTLQWSEGIRAEGVVREAFPRATRSLVHEADLAAVAVRALTTQGHIETTYDLTGPDPLTNFEQVAAIGAAIGRELRVETMPRAQARENLLGYGLPPDVADGILDAHAETETEPEPVTRTIEQVTGKPARTFQQWATDHADDFR